MNNTIQAMAIKMVIYPNIAWFFGIRFNKFLSKLYDIFYYKLSTKFIINL